MSKLKRFPERDIALNTRMYDLYVKKLDMKNGWHPGNQVYNFQTLLRLPEMAGIPLKDTAILDVGCGTGDLVPYLLKKGVKKYVGIDIYIPSLTQARKNYPTEQFIEGDLLAGKINDIFDYAFCSGALTIKLSVDNYAFFEAMIRKMWELTRIGLAFNVLTDDDTDPDHDLFFYNPEKIRSICESIDPNAKIIMEKTPRISQVHVYMYHAGEKPRTRKNEQKKNLLKKFFSQ